MSRATSPSYDSFVDEATHELTAPPRVGRIDKWVAELGSRGCIALFRGWTSPSMVGPAGRERVSCARGARVRGHPASRTLSWWLKTFPNDSLRGRRAHHRRQARRTRGSSRDLGWLFDKLDPHCGHPERPGIVHRLDKGTSGVMCVARTAYDGLTAQFAEHPLTGSIAPCAGGMPRRTAEPSTSHCTTSGS